MSILWLFWACQPEIKDTGDSPSNIAPVITWSTPDDRLIEGDALSIEATIEDADGIQSATLYYRGLGTSYWESTPLDNSSSNIWSTTIESLSVPGLELYIKAEDTGSPIATALYPVSGPSEPLVINVFPASQPLPFYEDFVRQEGELTLLDMDWWTPSETRDTYQWLLNESAGHTDASSVYHLRGSDGMPELRDWLISPPLDFSSETEVMVGWWEYGLAVDALVEHSLWVSTGSRLPDDGDFVQVEVLDTPVSGEWSKHRYIDLSAYAGEQQVYVGWRWTGSNADEWSVDDIEVRRLAPDLIVETISPSTSPNAQTSVAILIDNLTNGTGNDCETILVIPDGATPSSAILDGWSIDGLGSVVQEFDVTIDADVNPHSRIPYELVLTCGEDSWQFSDFIQVGQPSLAQSTIELSERTQLTAIVGYGDPSSPIWSDVMTQEIFDAGVHNLSVDVTDQYAFLPPEAGPERWFLQVESSSLAIIQNFTIGYGTTVVGTAETTISQPDFPAELLLPAPPVFEVLSQTPTSTEPGVQNQTITVELANFGEDSQGPVFGSLISSDSDVSVISSQLGMVDADVWTRNETHTVEGSIAVSDTHTSSTPVEVTILLADGVDSWTIPVSIEVPFPRLGITGVVVLDSGGNNDGKLDPNETAQLEIQIANSGGQNADGVVQAELSVEASSTATATVVNDNPSFGFVSAGAQKDEDDFSITVTSGSIGDTVDLLLSMEDNSHQYEDRLQLLLGEVPWIGVSPLMDDPADALDPAALDLERVEYRVNGSVVEMRLTSSTIIDPSTAFIEAWGRSGGAGYSYFRWVVQSGVGTLQGYIAGVGFQPLGALSVSYVDDHHIVWSFDSADLDLALTQFEIGFASGWCGPPEYYCDQYPDGWGYPYVSFNTNQWFDIEW